MKFRKSSAYHLVSECGAYSIPKVIVGGAVTYEAWHKPEGGKAAALRVGLSNSLDAIAACRHHSEQRGVAA